MLKAKLLGATAAAESLAIEDVFSTYLYTGNGSSQFIPNGLSLSNFGYGTSTAFNGSNHYFDRADLTGNSDGKTFTFSAWVKLDKENVAIYSSDTNGGGNGFNVLYTSANLRVIGYNSSGTSVIEFTLPQSNFGVGPFFHLLVSVDLTDSSKRHVYINGALKSPTWVTYTNANIDFTRTLHTIGRRYTDFSLLGNLAHIYLDYTYRDLSVEANRLVFRNASGGSTSPASLAALSPILYLPLTSDYSVGQNLGTGGNFTAYNSPSFSDQGTEIQGDSESALTWIKGRSGATDHVLYDTTSTGFISSNTTTAKTTTFGANFVSNGFSLPVQSTTNTNAATYASWTFRKAERFFDVVTWTGDGTVRAIPHNLGVVPGCVLVKITGGTTDNWGVWHRSLNNQTGYLILNSTAASGNSTSLWGNTSPTAANFYVGNNGITNASGFTYVAYLFAHDPLGPSGDGSDGLIACGSYTGNGSTTGPVVDLGWEPQWVLIKSASISNPWYIGDEMRGFTAGVADGGFSTLQPNASSAEATGTQTVAKTSTGFRLVNDGTGVNASGGTYIYIAIRRGPMREPTSGTQVLGLNARTGTGANVTVTGGLTADAVLVKNRGSSVASLFSSRMTGTGYLVTSTTAAEVAAGTTILQANPWDVMDGVKVGTTSTITNASSNTFINYLFKRAPGFFDVVAYTGDGVARTINHNLGVAPELIITKTRSGTTGWNTYVGALGADKYLQVNQQNAVATNTGYWNNTSPTESVFSVGANTQTNNSGSTYIAYLFASLPGISKVGSYTGNGSSQTINCGFTTGARFILIKRTDSTGYWCVWDSARGIVSGNDPFLCLNLTNAEFTAYDIVDPDSSGFIVNQESGFNMNVSSASYIYLAIA